MVKLNAAAKRRSKKGFTLVELVVVIAILGILAAIAIPAIIGIVNSASDTATEQDAAMLNDACKQYHAGVMTGLINSADPCGSTQSNLPAPKSGVAARKLAADHATVLNACEYAGLDKIKSQLVAGNMTYGYTSSGTIAVKDKTNTVVTAKTQLGDFITS